MSTKDNLDPRFCNCFSNEPPAVNFSYSLVIIRWLNRVESEYILQWFKFILIVAGEGSAFMRFKRRENKMEDFVLFELM